MQRWGWNSLTKSKHSATKWGWSSGFIIEWKKYHFSRTQDWDIWDGCGQLGMQVEVGQGTGRRTREDLFSWDLPSYSSFPFWGEGKEWSRRHLCNYCSGKCRGMTENWEGTNPHEWVITSNNVISPYHSKWKFLQLFRYCKDEKLDIVKFPN